MRRASLPAWRRWCARDATILALVLAFAVHSAEAPPLIVEPALQRIDLGVGERRTVRLTLRSHRAASVLAVEANCACIHPTTGLPLLLTAGQPNDLELTVVGMSSGMQPVTVRADVGSMSVVVQVVTNGMGIGRDQLAAAAKLAADRGDAVIVLIHDLHGQLRNCGCSAGSLGGIDRLAALPNAWASMAPTTSAMFVLTGDVDGSAGGVAAALAENRWRLGDAAIRVTDDVTPALAASGVLAVVPAQHVDLRHRRLVQPPLTDGMVAMVLLIGRDGEIDEQRVVPIDQTLPADATILERFPDAATKRVVSSPASDECMACHAGAHERWASSAHARAWVALTPANRTDGCVGCHSTPVEGGAITGGVHCQDCHPGAAAHVSDPSSNHLGAAVDCRTCHDARHHPEFDRMKAWEAIVHGR